MQVVAFIKGTKQMPMCGFSNTVVQILNATTVPYVTVNILEDDLLRSGEAYPFMAAWLLLLDAVSAVCVRLLNFVGGVQTGHQQARQHSGWGCLHLWRSLWWTVMSKQVLVT